jgi:hypothetical protein
MERYNDKNNLLKIRISHYGIRIKLRQSNKKMFDWMLLAVPGWVLKIFEKH